MIAGDNAYPNSRHTISMFKERDAVTLGAAGTQEFQSGSGTSADYRRIDDQDGETKVQVDKGEE